MSAASYLNERLQNYLQLSLGDEGFWDSGTAFRVLLYLLNQHYQSLYRPSTEKSHVQLVFILNLDYFLDKLC